MRTWGARMIVGWVSERFMGGSRDCLSLFSSFHRNQYPNRAYKSLTDIGAAAYVSGALGAYFNKQSGIKDRVNVEVWTGIIGISADFMPWVGR